MSNFKEIYPQKNFIENLHRMDSIEDDKEMGLVYTGPTQDAPTSAEYIWKEIVNTKLVSGTSLSIKDGINMPVYSYKIYGNANQAYLKGYNYCRVNDSCKISGSNVTGAITNYDNYDGYTNVGSLTTSVSWATLIVNTVSSNYDADIKNTDTVTAMVLGKFNGQNVNMYYGDTTKQGYVLLKKYEDVGNGWAWYYQTYTFHATATNCRPRVHINGTFTKPIYVAKFQILKGDKPLPYEYGGDKTPSVSTPGDISVVGTNNTTTKTWDIVFKDGSHTNNIALPQPLIKSREGKYDYILNQCAYYNNDRLILTGEENWLLDVVRTNSNITVIHMILPNSVKNTADIFCSHFYPTEVINGGSQIKIENQRLYLSFDKTVAPNLDLATKWLTEHNVLLFYPLKFERKVPIEQPIIICTKDGTTSITNNQNAQMDIEYRITPNALLYHKIGENEYERVTV